MRRSIRPPKAQNGQQQQTDSGPGRRVTETNTPRANLEMGGEEKDLRRRRVPANSEI